MTDNKYTKQRLHIDNHETMKLQEQRIKDQATPQLYKVFLKGCNCLFGNLFLHCFHFFMDLKTLIIDNQTCKESFLGGEWVKYLDTSLRT